jgi:hypothetical protein
VRRFSVGFGIALVHRVINSDLQRCKCQ